MTPLCPPTGHIFHDDCLQAYIGQRTPHPFPTFASHPCPACRSPFSLGEHRSTTHSCLNTERLRPLSAVPNADAAAVGSGLRRLYLNVDTTSPPWAHATGNSPRRRTTHHSAARTHSQRNQTLPQWDETRALLDAMAQHDLARALHDAMQAGLTTTDPVDVFAPFTRGRAGVQEPFPI